jgi:hypothetical protein
MPVVGSTPAAGISSIKTLQNVFSDELPEDDGDGFFRPRVSLEMLCGHIHCLEPPGWRILIGIIMRKRNERPHFLE